MGWLRTARGDGQRNNSLCPEAFFIPESLTRLGVGHPVASILYHSPISLQTYVVKVKRESPSEVTFVQRTFEEFQELHNKLRLLFPSSLLPRYPQTPGTRASSALQGH